MSDDNTVLDPLTPPETEGIDPSNTPPEPTIGEQAPDIASPDNCEVACAVPSKIDIDIAAVAAAKSVLDAAQAQLESDIAAEAAKLAAVQPHLDIMGEIESELSTEWSSSKETFDAVKSRVASLVERLRTLLTA